MEQTMEQTMEQEMILTDDLKNLIWKTYFTEYIIKKINKIKISHYNDILENVNIQMYPNVPNEEQLAYIWELTDIGDFIQIKHILKENETKNRLNYFGFYHWESIAITLDQFYSQPLPAQQEDIKNAKQHIPKYDFQNPQCDYFENKYKNFIDYKDSHSGASAGYCTTNITGFIMHTKKEKLKLWATHICNNVLNVIYKY